MNKFMSYALCLLALASVASANMHIAGIPDEETDSQSIMMTNDDEETKYLKPDMKLFSGFCIESRDETHKIIKDSFNGAAATVFNVMFHNIDSVEDTVLKATGDAVEQKTQELKEGANLISEVSVMPKDGTLSSPSEVKDKVEQTIEKTTLLGVISAAVKYILSIAVESAQSTFFERLALLRQMFTAEELKQYINESCQSLSYNLHGKLERRLQNFKSDAKRAAMKAGDDSERSKLIQSASLTNVGCVTAARVARLNMACATLLAAGSTIYPLLGLGNY